MSGKPIEVCLRYTVPRSTRNDSSLRPEIVAQAITSVFQATREPGSIRLQIPECHPAPCADAAFRSFAAAIALQLPGLPFYVLGGGSEFSRELILALLPNLSVAVDTVGTVSVHFPALETQTILHDHFTAMLTHGISEDAAVAEMSLLSKLIGMDGNSWA